MISHPQKLDPLFHLMDIPIFSFLLLLFLSSLSIVAFSLCVFLLIISNSILKIYQEPHVREVDNRQILMNNFIIIIFLSTVISIIQKLYSVFDEISNYNVGIVNCMFLILVCYDSPFIQIPRLLAKHTFECICTLH